MAEYAEVEGVEDFESDADGTERTPDGKFSYYDPATAQFAPDELTGRARRVYDAFRELNIDTLQISYNGGYDEGFAQLESARSDEAVFTLEALTAQLKDGPLGEIVGEDEGELFVWHPDTAQIPRAQWAQEAIWELVETCASSLLGQGYGTGECSIYGRCRVNLVTGEIVDEPTEVEDLPAGADKSSEE